MTKYKEKYEWEKAGHGATEQELKRFKKMYAELFEKYQQQQLEIERNKEYTEHLQHEIQWQYGKLNQISDLIEMGRNESKKLFPVIKDRRC